MLAPAYLSDYTHSATSRRNMASGRPGYSGRSDVARLKKLKLGIKYDDPLYPGLCKLKINGRDLNNLPPELFTLLEVELLDLSPERKASIYYKLNSVPPAISNLINLKVLVLDTNELELIPMELTLLVNLERLCISNNLLMALPDGFQRLTKLKSLHAANNRFSVFPSSVYELKQLEFLDMSDNLLTSLPAAISKMTSLQTLLLVMNRLKELPDTICRMTQLRSLWVGNNRLTKLPKKFGDLEDLDWGDAHTSSLAVGENPLVHPPVEVCIQGVDEIRSYFQRLEKIKKGK